MFCFSPASQPGCRAAGPAPLFAAIAVRSTPVVCWSPPVSRRGFASECLGPQTFFFPFSVFHRRPFVVVFFSIFSRHHHGLHDCFAISLRAIFLYLCGCRAYVEIVFFWWTLFRLLLSETREDFFLLRFFVGVLVVGHVGGDWLHYYRGPLLRKVLGKVSGTLVKMHLASSVSPLHVRHFCYSFT